MAVIVKVTKLL